MHPNPWACHEIDKNEQSFEARSHTMNIVSLQERRAGEEDIKIICENEEYLL